MNADERIALRYLSELGPFSIRFEPDGKIPPDFLLDGTIAVEVRRLNQNYFVNASAVRGLETEQFALVNIMREILSSLGPPKSGKSWFVRYRFTRPLPPLPKLKGAIRNALVAFRDGQISLDEFSISHGFVLGLMPAHKCLSDEFVLGGYLDRNAGGWLASMLESNVKLCIREKSEKIAQVRHKYHVWWLEAVS